MPGVLADTSVWVDFFRGTPRVPDEFEQLIKTAQMAVCGIVLAELLCGIRNPAEREKLEAAFAGLDYLETNRDTWILAGTILADLRRDGLTIPTSDAILAALAIQHNRRLLTWDQHFRHVPKLRVSLLK